jgi:dolichol kinase
MNDLPSVEHSYGAELVRKGIHLCSVSIPVIYYFISRSTALSILVPLTLLFLLSDVARLFHESTGRLYDRFFGFLLRSHEKNNRGRQLTGATYVLLSATIGVWLFPKVIFITAFAILIVSDTAAALIGRRWGKHPFLAKSVEGTTAFFVTALIVVAVAPKIDYLATEYLIGTVAALAGTLVEASPIRIDDNVSIPFSIGGVMWLLYAVFLPAINMFALDALV